MEEFIEVNDQFYVLASSSLADQRIRVLKHDDTLAVFDAFGDMRPVSQSAQGIYDGATRHLSSLGLKICGTKPMLLSSNVKYNNSRLTVDLTNRDILDDDGHGVTRGTVHIQRSKVLWQNACYEQVRLMNFGVGPLKLSLSSKFGADFKDMFEIRGVRRERHGEISLPDVSDRSISYSYAGLDGVIRTTHLQCSPPPSRITEDEVVYSFRLEPQEERLFEFVTVCGAADRRLPSFHEALKRADHRAESVRQTGSRVRTTNTQFDNWIRRSSADLYMMITETEAGHYPYAGVPWFNTVFGRDGIITAYQMLWINSEIARGVLTFLARTQASERDAFSDAEPGKILHELRRGEMVATGEVPFQRYYGSSDATPLFIVLADAYEATTGDLEFIRSVWPNIMRALHWIDHFGDQDGDGFVEYLRQSPRGLRNQGWKDSDDSVFHEDGELAQGPIALCEVQGYVYQAKRGAARLARRLGDGELSARLETQAAHLKRVFEETYWCEELCSYGLALDGEKKLCRVRSSNAGHLLFSKIVGEERALRMAEGFFGADMFSGWGIRTISTASSRYNPMSYHNGAIWPHDNALIAEGLGHYGEKARVLRLVEALFHVSETVDLNRLPELYCGFPRRTGEGPTLYPVACLPQAWASGSVFSFLKALLGMHVDGVTETLRFHAPVLPDYLPHLTIHNMRVGRTLSDLIIRQPKHGSAKVEVVPKKGTLQIEIIGSI